MKLGCHYCKGYPDPGFIESDNNGPIYGCPVCNAEYNSEKARRQREFDRAMDQRRRSGPVTNGDRQ